MSLCISQYDLGKALLPILVAPLIYFTSYNKFMTIEISGEIEEFNKTKILSL